MGSLNRLYPVFADLEGRDVRVVGGGAVAERKVRMLLDSGARVRVGAPDLTPALRTWVRAGRLIHDPGLFDEAWLDGAWLVIAATGDAAVNAQVKALADRRRIFANVVDDPAHSSFQVPAVVDRSPILVAISSGGAAPVLARRLRERLEALFDHALGDLGRLAHRYRSAIRAMHPALGARREFYDWLFDGPVLAHLRAGDGARAERALCEGLRAPRTPQGRVITLIHAGGSDPASLTLGGLRALNEADLVAYAVGTDAGLLGLARRDADRHSLADEALRDAASLAEALDRLDGRHRRIAVLAAGPVLAAGGLAAAARRLGEGNTVCRVIPQVASSFHG